MPYKSIGCPACGEDYSPRRPGAKHGSCSPAKKILIIPDTQVKPGVPIEHLGWIGRYISEKRPDVVVHLGDHFDMPSLSSYDKGKKSFEGRRYRQDIDAGRRGMGLLFEPVKNTVGYSPELHFTLGNHEDRITRAVEDDAKLEGTIGLFDLDLESYGWTVHPFLKPVEIAGIEFAHYFTSGVMGRPVNSAATLLRARQGSAVMGHVQRVDMAIHEKTQKFGMFAGCAYLHDEEYLGHQGNTCKRQIVMLHEAKDGLADPMFVSLDYLRKKFK